MWTKKGLTFLSISAMSLGFSSYASSVIKRNIKQISWICTFLLESIKIQNINYKWQLVSFHKVISVLYAVVLILVHKVKWVICCGFQFKIQTTYIASLPWRYLYPRMHCCCHFKPFQEIEVSSINMMMS